MTLSTVRIPAKEIAHSDLMSIKIEASSRWTLICWLIDRHESSKAVPAAAIGREVFGGSLSSFRFLAGAVAHDYGGSWNPACVPPL